MKAVPWNIHIVDGLGRIQCGKLHSELFRLVSLNFAGAAGLIKLFESLVPEGNYHWQSVACCATQSSRLTLYYEQIPLPGSTGFRGELPLHIIRQSHKGIILQALLFL